MAAALRGVAEERFGPVDVLVTCPGAPEPLGSTILSISVEDWHALLDAHLTATFVPARELAPGMVERGRGGRPGAAQHRWRLPL